LCTTSRWTSYRMRVLDRVAEEVFYGFKLAEARGRLYSIDEAVRGVVDRYGAYTKVEFLKS
jgi:hypothetical protein